MTPDEIRRHATEIILDHARDVESLSIGEHLEGAGLTDAEHDEACQQIDEAIQEATVTVEWPEPDPTPAPLGFYVLVRQHDRWVADWDGELHPTREAGEKSLAEARKDGWEAVLTAAVPFPINTEEG